MIIKISSIIDHTLLKADATEGEIKKLCLEAIEHQFYSVCVNPSRVELASSLLKNSKVKVCTVIGFPLGATSTHTKVFETIEAIKNGASEIDVVINIGALKDGNCTFVEDEITQIVKESRGRALVKVILETSLLTDDEKVMACEAAKRAGADFVKTSTGFSSNGATVEDVALMRKTVGNTMGVKASGGVRTLEKVKEMMKAGANRIGTSSGVSIVKNMPSK